MLKDKLSLTKKQSYPPPPKKNKKYVFCNYYDSIDLNLSDASTNKNKLYRNLNLRRFSSLSKKSIYFISIQNRTITTYTISFCGCLHSHSKQNTHLKASINLKKAIIQ